MKTVWMFLFGSLLEGGKTLHIEQVGSFKLDPKSSILVKESS